MSSQVLSSPDPASALRAILASLAEGAGNEIAALPDRAEERVHSIRVSMKKLRALLGLASPGIKKSRVSEINLLAREVKNGFGSQRDEAVQAALLRRLLGAGPAREALAALSTVRKELPAPAPDRIAASAARLAGLIHELKPASISRKDLLDVWAGTYRSARRVMRACAADTSDDFLFHEWRKRVKHLLYQSAALGAPLDTFVPDLDELSSLLGLHHDLAVLCENIHLCGAAAERTARRNKKKTARLAMQKGAGIFAKSPSEIIKKEKIR